MLKYGVFEIWNSSWVSWVCTLRGTGLEKFWGEIFRMGFLVALIMPQTATTISSPSEGCSCKTEGSGYIPFSTQNEELAYIRFHNWLAFWVETWIYAKNDLTSFVENTGPKWVWSRVNWDARDPLWRPFSYELSVYQENKQFAQNFRPWIFGLHLPYFRARVLALKNNIFYPAYDDFRVIFLEKRIV